MSQSPLCTHKGITNPVRVQVPVGDEGDTRQEVDGHKKQDPWRCGCQPGGLGRRRKRRASKGGGKVGGGRAGGGEGGEKMVGDEAIVALQEGREHCHVPQSSGQEAQCSLVQEQTRRLGRGVDGEGEVA